VAKRLFGDAFRGRKVLVTGHTGFKGSWLSAWLLSLGAKVSGLSNGVPTKPSNFEAIGLEKRITHFDADIRSAKDVARIINEVKPDFVFHLAAQSLVRMSFEEPVKTLETNVLGTMNVLEALRKANRPCNAVMITSDKCYDNVEWVWGYRETDHLGGKDPYSASKGAAEMVIKTYARTFFSKPESRVKVASTRAGNVIGGGDWAPDRIVPDCVRAWSSGKPVQIRSPKATRPWQFVLEPLSGYLALGHRLSEKPGLNGEPFNFGPRDSAVYTVAELIAEMQKHWPGASVRVEEERDSGEATLLKLSCDKALHFLGWKANLNFGEAARFTADWYRSFYERKADMFEETNGQIQGYVALARERGQAWAT
jgi:CDP-glucose 4,6-dehydratase